MTANVVYRLTDREERPRPSRPDKTSGDICVCRRTQGKNESRLHAKGGKAGRLNVHSMLTNASEVHVGANISF